MRKESLEGRVGKILRGRGIERVLLGLSGGADSVALLLLLLKAGVEVRCVHCNFGLRGEESERDMRFAEELCARLNVPLEIIRFDVEAYCREHQVSVEMACRELRYEEFRRLRRAWKCQRIAVAHHADDNIETLLLNLFRGSGVAGLRAMKEDTGEIIRPLLSITRNEILDYLKSCGQPYVTDSSNLHSDYRRNFIRNEVLPMIEQRWPGVRKSLRRTAGIMAREEAALEEFDRRLAEEYSIEEARSMPNCDFSESPAALRRLTLFLKSRGVAPAIIAEIADHASQGRLRPGSRWNAAEGVIEVSASAVEWVESGEWRVESGEWRVESGELRVESGEGRVERIDKLRDEFEITEHILTEDLLREIKQGGNEILWTSLRPEEIEFRYPERGDRIRQLGMKGSRAVSDLVAEAKLAPSERKEITVAVIKENGGILWVEGLRRSREALAQVMGAPVWKITRRRVRKDP